MATPRDFSASGAPAALRHGAGSDARIGRPALPAVVHVRALAPGRHEPTVAGAQPPGEAAASHRIPSWR